MLDLLKLGTTPIKRFDHRQFYDMVKSDVRDIEVGSIEGKELYDSWFDIDYYQSKIEKFLNKGRILEGENTILVFNNVGTHIDEHWKKRYFIHVVLLGKGTINLYRPKYIHTEHKYFLHKVNILSTSSKPPYKSLQIKRGDIFLLDPTTYHEYVHESKSHPMTTLSFTIQGLKLNA